jgi:hypothetical protein
MTEDQGAPHGLSAAPEPAGARTQNLTEDHQTFGVDSSFLFHYLSPQNAKAC